MKLADLDQRNGGATARCLQWLNTLLHSPTVPWNPGQREAAASDLLEALRLQGSELLTLAQAAHVPPGIDREPWASELGELRALEEDAPGAGRRERGTVKGSA